ASGRPVSARAAASSRRIAAAPATAIVPRPPASDTAAASSCRLSPPPIPACTTGISTPRHCSTGTLVSLGSPRWTDLPGGGVSKPPSRAGGVIDHAHRVVCGRDLWQGRSLPESRAGSERGLRLLL